MKTWICALSFAATGAILLGVSCAPAQGSEGASCFPNGTCNVGLQCRSEGNQLKCIDPNATGTGGSASGSGGTAGIDLTACFECGDAACGAEKSDCDIAPGCSELLSCTLECAGDASCNSGCDVDGLTTEEASAAVQLAAAYIACSVPACTSECSVSVPGGSGGASGSGGAAGSTGGAASTGGNVGTGEPCTTAGESRGSCASSSFEICSGTEWTVGDCAGCGIVAPTSECSQIYVKTFQEAGEDEIVAVEGDVREVIQTSDLVGAEWYLDAGQMGVIQFVAESPIDASRVELQGGVSGVGFITLETPDGLSGCQYTLDSTGRLQRYNLLGLDDYGYTVVHWYGCWGSFSAYTNSTEPGTATVLSIRTEVAATNQIVPLSLSAILL